MQESKHATQHWSRLPAQWSLSDEYKCAQGAPFEATLQRFMQCIGARTQGNLHVFLIWLNIMLIWPLCSHILFEFQEPSVCFSRWQTYSMGQLHHKQSACYSPSFKLGYDMRLCTIWILCCLWWPGQHLLYLQVRFHFAHGCRKLWVYFHWWLFLLFCFLAFKTITIYV